MRDQLYFALFVDVLGVASAFAATPDNVDKASPSRSAKRQVDDASGIWVYALTTFHRLIGTVFREDTEAAGSPSRELVFVAEFSDSAFAIYRDPRAALRVAYRLINDVLWDEDGIPLRVGIGRGFFVHRGTSFSVDNEQPWSACQFFGSAVVRAYLAERSPAKGIRAFVHQSAVQALKPAYRDEVLLELPPHEASPGASHEIRVWDGNTDRVAANIWRMRQSFDPSNRAPHHYDGTLTAVERMRERSDEEARSRAMKRGRPRQDRRPTHRFSGRASRAAER